MGFKSSDNRLYIENGKSRFAVSDLTKNLDTPFYLYDLDGLRIRAEAFKSALNGRARAHFAMKSNHNAHVLGVFKELGFGVDVVSGGELALALQRGFKASDVVFSGVGKTSKEIKMWLEAAKETSAGQINVESLAELERIENLAVGLNKKVRVALRINPDVEADTHPHIRTGYRDNKFGIDIQDLPPVLDVLKKSKTLQLCGLSVHIGSQILDVSSLERAFEKSLRVHQDLVAQGFQLSTFDVGGGLGIQYEREDESDEMELLQRYGRLVAQVADQVNVQVLCEPGRFLVARSGVLICEVQYVKKTSHKNFLIVDTGMHHLMRPALYQAHHRILHLESTQEQARSELYDVVGPICESTDVIGRERVFHTPKSGDRLAIMDAGAYGAVMSSDYNLNARAREYVVTSGQVRE